MAAPKLNYYKHDWFNSDTKQQEYGIDVRVIYPTCRWSQRVHCAENGKPLIYATEGERDEKLKALRHAAKAKAPVPQAA